MSLTSYYDDMTQILYCMNPDRRDMIDEPNERWVPRKA